MDFDENNTVSGGPIFGAIFMCNRNTRKECLKRKLFGLPSSQASFVKKIKVGMALFLFEYEEKKLYGVFQASTDGAMNIVPHAFKSSGKSIPAQIRFKTIWLCKPLREHDFRDAIMDNYYTANKFNLGLSENQVFKLLCLFNSRRIESHKPQTRFPAKSGYRNADYVGLSSSADDRLITTQYRENGQRMGNGNLGKNYRLSRSNSNQSGISDKLYVEADSPPGDRRRRLSSLEPQQSMDWLVPTSQRDLDNDNKNYYSNYGKENSEDWAGRSCFGGLVGNTSADVFPHFSRSEVVPSKAQAKNLHSSFRRSHTLDAFTGFEDYIPLSVDHGKPSRFEDYVPLSVDHGNPSRFEDYIPLSVDRGEPSISTSLSQEASFSRNESIVPGNFSNYHDASSSKLSHNCEGYSGFSFAETNLATLPLLRQGDLGTEHMGSSVLNPGNVSSRMTGCNHPSMQECEYEGSPFLDSEPPNASMTRGKSLMKMGFVPLNSQSDFRGGVGNDINDKDRVESVLYSDVSKNRASVFSRLSGTRKMTEQHDAEDDENVVDMSVNQLMNSIFNCQKSWRTKKAKHHILLKDPHCLEFGVDTVNGVKKREFNDIQESDIPINFKRRSEVQKSQVMKGGCEESVGLLSTTVCKRRKLVRPSFVKGDVHDQGTMDNQQHGSQQSVVGNGNIGSGGSPVRIEVTEKEVSQNVDVRVVVSPTSTRGNTEEVSNNLDLKIKVEAFIQELNGISDCSLCVEASSQDVQISCKGDSRKTEEGSGMLLNEANNLDTENVNEKMRDSSPAS